MNVKQTKNSQPVGQTNTGLLPEPNNFSYFNPLKADTDTDTNTETNTNTVK
jgi:hypothetical protein